MTALELTELDLSYAPPYSSAKHPVNMAGFMIEDLESGKVRQFHWNEVEDLPCDGNATLLDVRTEGEYRRGHLNGFRNIPLDDLREHLDELDRGKPVYVNCQTGLRSYLACRLLTQYGFTCSHLSGGYSFYQVVIQGAADSAERLSLRNGEAMSENLFGLTVAADKGLDDLAVPAPFKRKSQVSGSHAAIPMCAESTGKQVGNSKRRVFICSMIAIR